MKLNFNILKQKLSNLNNIILPNTNTNYSNSNYILKKRYDTNNSYSRNKNNRCGIVILLKILKITI